MKHFVIYFEDTEQMTTTPREWARQNQSCFPNFNFSDSDTSNTPSTDTVARHLLRTGFKLIEFDNNKLYVRL